MRLLYVIDSLAPGGAETSLAEMAPSLVSLGIELHVLSLGPRLDLKDRLQTAGVVVHLGAAKHNRLNGLRRTMRLISALKPDLVHTTLYESDVIGRSAARVRGVPSSTSLVGDTYGRRPQGTGARLKIEMARNLDLLTSRFAARFHAVSQHLSVAAMSYLGVPSGLIEVIPRGRDPRRFPFRSASAREVTRHALGIDARDAVILAVGRLEPVKGLNYLMEAIPRVASAIPNLRILVAGKNGLASDSLRAGASRSGVPVTFLGHREDVGNLLAAADVLAFPSLSEGSPGTLIEAMAVGCPIVASDIPPNREVLGTGAECVGLTVPVAQVEGLAETLIEALSRPSELEALTTEARNRFEAQFEITAVAERMARFFDRAAA